MITPDTLRGVFIKAADPGDGDDIATRRLLAAELGIIVSTCPHAGEGASTAAQLKEARSADECVLGGPLTPACRECLLSG
jgi:hypothetical protein